MAIEGITYFPVGTIPECTGFAKGIALNVAGGSKYKQFPKGQIVFAYDNTRGATGKFRYVFAKVRQTLGRPVHWSAAGKIAGAAGATASAIRAGVTCALISNSSYGFIQTEGMNFFGVQTDNGIAAGDQCIKDQASLFIDTITMSAIGTQIGWIMARALAADSGSFMAPGTLNLTCE